MTFSNAAISGSSCGVEIASGGKFIMESGTVSGASGKQAVLCSNGTFDMNGGTVTGGTSYGVMLSGTSAKFNLSGGTVSALNPTEQSAVYANSPGFTLNAAAATVNGRISLPDPTYVINLSGVPGVGKTFDVAVGRVIPPASAWWFPPTRLQTLQAMRRILSSKITLTNLRSAVMETT